MTDKDYAEPTNVSLYPEDRARVARMQERYGMSFSAAIRAIIAEWDRLDRRALVDSGAEYVTDGARGGR